MNSCSQRSGAMCVNSSGSYSCVCALGYTGAAGGACADVNECTLSHSCSGWSTCTNTVGIASPFFRLGVMWLLQGRTNVSATPDTLPLAPAAWIWMSVRLGNITVRRPTSASILLAPSIVLATSDTLAAEVVPVLTLTSVPRTSTIVPRPVCL